VQAGKCNATGYIYLNETLPYTDEMLSTIFNRPLNTVRLALNIFQKFDMIELNEDGVIYINNWEKHQNIEGLEKIREQTRLRVAKHREQKKIGYDVTGTVTLRNATDKIRKEKNIKIRGKENRFSPPSLDEVKKYCSERKNQVNSEKWFDFYQAKNWMIGKNKMKDWKAAVRTWEHKEENNGTRWTGNTKSDTGGINRETADEIERLNEKWRKLHPVSTTGDSR
jgi:predicted phage replisome organizer